VSLAMAGRRPTGTERAAATERPLGPAGRLGVGALVVAGVIVGAPSGFGVFWYVPYAGVGALLVVRRPSTSIGWILLGLGWCLAMATITVNATARQFAAGSVGPVTAGVAVITSLAGTTGFVLFGLLAIVFPSGRMPSGRWRRPAQLVVAAGFATVAVSAVMPYISVNVWGAPTSIPVRNPAALLPDLGIWQIITPDDVIVPVIVLLIASTVSVVARFRRATGVERQQLRWFTAALAFVVLAVVAGFVIASLVPGAMESGVAWLGAIVAFPCVAIAVGIAVLRYRLYEIDRIVSRTIGWAIVTGVLVSVFAAGVVLLQAVLAPFTQENTIAVAASTLIAFALFQPLRRRVQHAVDRRFDRARYDGEQTVQAFSGRLRHETDLARAATALLATASDSVHPTTAGVWLRGPGR
jgi:hypothetical protein